MRLALPVLIALACLIVLLPRAARRRGLFAACALILLYAVLKLTGVIEAIAPSRDGVF